jgi:hypothetical protein
VYVSELIFWFRNTLFAAALYECFNGGCCVPDEPLVSLERLFQHLKVTMRRLRELAQIPVPASASQTSPPGEDADGTHPKKPFASDEEDSEKKEVVQKLDVPNQTSALILPRRAPFALENPVCCRCGPPCAPDRPYIVRVGPNEVLLEWYNPGFDGIAPIRYQVSVFSQSRNFHTWTPVYYPGEIRKNSFLVRNLPAGIPCQFRVQGYNRGGWGANSDETIRVIPGEEQQPVNSYLRWRKLCKGGALTILDRLDMYPDARYEHIQGLQKLIVFASKASGIDRDSKSVNGTSGASGSVGITGGSFSKGMIPVKTILAAIYALHKFPHDPEIAGPAFRVIAWCLRLVVRASGPYTMKDKIVKLLCQHDISALCVDYMATCRENTSILGSVGMIRSSFKEYKQQLENPDISTAKSIKDYDKDKNGRIEVTDSGLMIPHPEPIPDDDINNRGKRNKKAGHFTMMSPSDYGADEPENDDDDDSDSEEDVNDGAETKNGGVPSGTSKRIAHTHAIAPFIGHEEMWLQSKEKVEQRLKERQLNKHPYLSKQPVPTPAPAPAPAASLHPPASKAKATTTLAKKDTAGAGKGVQATTASAAALKNKR